MSFLLFDIVVILNFLNLFGSVCSGFSRKKYHGKVHKRCY